MDAKEMADRVAEILESGGYAAKVWAKGGYVRVYVKRELSKRTQDMGFVTVCSNGTRSYKSLTRQLAGIRDLVEDSINA
jgi:hypothetical protein